MSVHFQRVHHYRDVRYAVFPVQNVQNRESLALQHRAGGLPSYMKCDRPEMINLATLSEKVLGHLRERFQSLRGLEPPIQPPL